MLVLLCLYSMFGESNVFQLIMCCGYNGHEYSKGIHTNIRLTTSTFGYTFRSIGWGFQTR